ncbi:MAG TPA: cytochrome c oxidase assembly protein, partial [Stellaceae bacterium]|nr:cytochrome c oxidase assembly protein [Stellaceae bacterium]
MLAGIIAPASAQSLATELHRSAAWSWEPWVLASLALAAFWYGAGVWRLWRRLGPTPRGGTPRDRRSRGDPAYAARGPRNTARVLGAGAITAFAAGLGTIFIAFESPIDSIGEQLFCIHMLQHLLLMLAAAPLLVLGRPALAFLWAFAPGGRKRIGRAWTALGLHTGVRAIMHPVVVWLLFYGTFIFWHFPGPYQAALRN